MGTVVATETVLPVEQLQDLFVISNRRGETAGVFLPLQLVVFALLGVRIGVTVSVVEARSLVAAGFRF